MLAASMREACPAFPGRVGAGTLANDLPSLFTRPNAFADTNDFEFEALSKARNYRHALFEQFGPYLEGVVAEIGAGIGQMTELLCARAGVKQAVAVEPDGQYCAKHKALHPNHEVVNGTAADL